MVRWDERAVEEVTFACGSQRLSAKSEVASFCVERLDIITTGSDVAFSSSQQLPSPFSWLCVRIKMGRQGAADSRALSGLR